MSRDLTANVSRLEWLALGHMGFLVIFASWAFGGNVVWAANVVTGSMPIAGLVTLAEFLRRKKEGREALRPMIALLPWLVFNALVVASIFHPNHRSYFVEGSDVFTPQPTSIFWPSTARPSLTWRALGVFDATFLPAFNLLLAVRSRSKLRGLLLAVCLNAAVLAVFGSLQKLGNASGIFFGRVPSPNTAFFSTFFYHNHWGAFALLSTSVTNGLTFHAATRSGYRDWLHSPLPAGVLAILALSATAPLSSSRSCTVLISALLVVAATHAVVLLRRHMLHHRNDSRSTIAIGFAVFGIAILIFALGYLAKPVLTPRIEQTRAQIASMQLTGSVGARAQLYRDTIRLGLDQPLFGWGLGSYGTTFVRYNTLTAIDGLPQYYEDAHSDWLQAFAETGVVGIICRVLIVAFPLALMWMAKPISALPGYLLLGCGFVTAYAWVEFPFGNVAVTLLAWMTFFSAVRLAQLDQREHPSRTILV